MINSSQDWFLIKNDFVVMYPRNFKYAKIEDMKDNGDVEFTDLFDLRQPRSPKELIEERLAICNECPALNKRLMKCKKCGCFMKLKATLHLAQCPIGKW